MSSNFMGPIPQGVTRNSYAGFYRTAYGDVSPRVGAVWQMTKKPELVLRRGFRIYYDQHSGNVPGEYARTSSICDVGLQRRSAQWPSFVE